MIAAAIELPQHKESKPNADIADVIDYSFLLPLIRQPSAADLDINVFLSGIYPSIEILRKTKEIDERLLYIHQAYISQIVEFLIQGYDNPMGVATYKTVEDVRKVLPAEEELRKVMDEEG